MRWRHRSTFRSSWVSLYDLPLCQAMHALPSAAVWQPPGSCPTHYIHAPLCQSLAALLTRACLQDCCCASTAASSTSFSSVLCRWVQEGFLRGADLLSHLHAQLQDADTEAAPILRFLLLATVQPYLGHMRSWLQSTTPVQSGFAAMPATGLQAVSRAEVSRTDDFEEQVRPCPRSSSRGFLQGCALSCTSRNSHYPETAIADCPTLLEVDSLVCSWQRFVPSSPMQLCSTSRRGLA